MKYRVLVISIFLVTAFMLNNLFAQSLRNDCSNDIDLRWVKTAGGIENDQILDITIDDDGNIYFTGYFQNQLNFQGTAVIGVENKDMFVAKTDSDGNLIWIKSGIGSGDIFGSGIDLDSDGNIYLTGTFTGSIEINDETFTGTGADVFLIKFNNDGDYLWGKYFGGFQDDYSGDVKVDNDNNVIISASYFSSMYFEENTIMSNGGIDFIIAKYDSDGNFIWVTDEGSNQNIFGERLAIDNNNNIYLTGKFSGTFNIGFSNISANGFVDVYLVKYDTNGNPIWLKSVGSTGNQDDAADIDTDTQNNIYVSVKVDRPDQQGRVIKYNTNGQTQFDFFFGNDNTVPKGMIIDENFDIYITGSYSGIIDFGDGQVNSVGENDFFFVKYDASASLLYKYIAGSSLADSGNKIAVDSENNIVIGGFCNNSIYFGGNPYFSQGLSDLMLVKFERYFSFGEVSISSNNCNPNDMCASIEVIGGEEPIDFLWSNSQTEQNICGISVGNYSVTATDNTGCEIQTQIEVVLPDIEPVNLPADIEICPFEEYELSAGENYSDYYWSTDESGSSIIISEPGTYSVTVSDQNECVANASTTITQIPEQNLFENEEEYLCFDESKTIVIEGYQEYLWSDNSTENFITINSETELSLQVYDGNCYHYDTVNILIHPNTEINLGEDKVICSGETIVIDAGGDYISYLWHDNSNQQTYSTNTEETVSVTVTDSNQCSSSDEISVSAVDSPEVNLGEDMILCTDEPVILNPGEHQMGNTYLWSDGSDGETLEVSESGEYWVIVTNFYDCSSSDTINIKLFPGIDLELEDEVHICDGETHTFLIDEIYETYLWSNGDTTNTITVSETGLYSLTVTDSNNCEDSAKVFVEKHFIPSPNLGKDTSLCSGETYIISSTQSYENYLWQDGSSNDEYLATQSGTYSVTVSNEYNCSNSSSVNILFYENPEITSFSMLPGEVTLVVEGGTSPYQYTHDKTENVQESALFQNLIKGTYIFQVIDINGCIDETEIDVEGIVQIPSFFTPNGDGVNDFWEIIGIEDFPNAEIVIFDRFSKRVAEFNSTNMRWDGRYNGIILPSDTYWYVIHLEPSREPITGSVTIKR